MKIMRCTNSSACVFFDATCRTVTCHLRTRQHIYLDNQSNPPKEHKSKLRLYYSTSISRLSRAHVPTWRTSAYCYTGCTASVWTIAVSRFTRELFSISVSAGHAHSPVQGIYPPGCIEHVGELIQRLRFRLLSFYSPIRCPDSINALTRGTEHWAFILGCPYPRLIRPSEHIPTT